MMMIEADEVWVDVALYHPFEAAEELRRFDATAWAPVGQDAEAPDRIGEIDGYVCLALEQREIRDAADDIDTDTELLGRVADEIVAVLNDEFVQKVTAVVLVGTARILPQLRGHGLFRVLVDRLLDTLQLDPVSTLVVVRPEPQLEKSGPMEVGPARDAALVSLRRHLQAQGFRQWANTVVWWRPIPHASS